MKLEYQSKSLRYGVDGNPSKAQINLGNAEGAVYPVFLSPDVIEKSDSELYELAMEEVYEQNFPHRAENEKFNLIGERLGKVDDAIDEANQALADFKENARQQMAENKAQIDQAVADLTALVMGNLVPMEEAEVEE